MADPADTNSKADVKAECIDAMKRWHAETGDFTAMGNNRP